MLTTFFLRSNPAQYIMILLLIIIYIILKINLSIFTINELVFIAPLIIGVFYAIIKFIISKNNLTKKNNYGLISLFILVCLLIESSLSYKVYSASFFLLLALRRMLSLRSPINIQKKVFDASFWIFISSLFYPPTLMFSLLLLIALILYTHFSLKNIVIILFAKLCAISISYLTSFFLIDKNNFSTIIENYLYAVTKLNFPHPFVDSSNLLTQIYLFFFLAFLISYIWTRFISTNERRRSTSLIILISILCFLVIDKSNKTSYIFLLFPFVVLISNFFQINKQTILVDLIFVVLLITPFLSLFL